MFPCLCNRAEACLLHATMSRESLFLPSSRWLVLSSRGTQHTAIWPAIIVCGRWKQRNRWHVVLPEMHRYRCHMLTAVVFDPLSMSRVVTARLVLHHLNQFLDIIDVIC